MAFRQIDNINMFLKGCQAMGMPASDCFGAKKLFDEGDCRKEVLNTLESLGGLCQAQGVAVPVFGKNKYATKNMRVWTDEQKLRQARADRGSMLMQGCPGRWNASASPPAASPSATRPPGRAWAA